MSCQISIDISGHCDSKIRRKTENKMFMQCDLNCFKMGSTDVKFKVLCHQTVENLESMNDFEVFRLPIKSINLV